MKITTFHKSMMRAAVLALCTATLSTAPMLVAQDNAAPPPPSQQQDNMGPAGPGGRRGGGRQVERLTKQLNLTPDQVTQVKAIDADTMIRYGATMLGRMWRTSIRGSVVPAAMAAST